MYTTITITTTITTTITGDATAGDRPGCWNVDGVSDLFVPPVL